MRLNEVDNFLLLGGGPLLEECARTLQDKGRRVRVITSPRHAQEPSSFSENSLEAGLRARGLDCQVIEDIQRRDLLDHLTPTTLALSFGAAWIFRKNWISRLEGRLLNLHGRRLPYDRGGGGYSWQILNDDRLGYCVIHQIEEKVDTGPILKLKEFFYPASCRIPKDYAAYYVQQNRDFLREFFQEIQEGESFQLISQAEYLSSYWPRLSSEHHGYVDWSWGSRELERFICAFDEPYRGASSFVRGHRVFLKNCISSTVDGTFHPFQSGLVYRKSDSALFVASREGTLILRSITDEQNQDVKNKLRVGDRFHTPVELLEKAKQFRAHYSAKGLERSETPEAWA